MASMYCGVFFPNIYFRGFDFGFDDILRGRLFDIKLSIYFCSIVKSLSILFLESTSTNQWSQLTN